MNKPTLILAHNKTLAAQLYSEFKEYFSVTYRYDLPYKNLVFCEEDCVPESHTDISWWNTAACMLSDMVMAELPEREGNLCVGRKCCVREHPPILRLINKRIAIILET